MPHVLGVDDDRIVDTVIDVALLLRREFIVGNRRETGLDALASATFGAMPVVTPPSRRLDSMRNFRERARAERPIAMSGDAIAKYRRSPARFSYNDTRTGRYVRPTQAVRAQYTPFIF